MISTIIAILIFAFISFVFFQEKMTVKHGFTKEAISNTLMGFDYLKRNDIAYDTKTSLKLFEEQKGNTSIIKKHWGGFDVAIVKSKIKNEFFQKIGLLGIQNSKRDALYLSENNTSLVLVGNTKITGNASLPRQGVKGGNITGVSYYGSDFIYGNTKTSSSSLPRIKNISFIKDFYKNYYENEYENFELEDDLNLHRPFSKSTLLYEDTLPIILQNITLSGNIIIVSKTSISISPTAILEDVILLAPKITINSGFKGNFQAIASKNILVKSNCFLNYPTALILLEDDSVERNNLQSNTSQAEEHQIIIEKNSEVKGIIVFDSKSKDSSYLPQIKIEENTSITEEVYCQKNLELLGAVNGSVYTQNFITKQSGSTYMNHIYNGVINVKKLPNQYAGLQLGNQFNTVAK